ncbi:MAG: VCBS repeat-containing protein, partial [Verrucomicrobia bacterium]|nr:VCBS repeat-containing protein [Verrucomicrobiota bacterium]
SRGYAERWPREGLGVTGDLPVPADYDGDGKADPAVARKFDGRIRVRLSTTGKIWMASRGSKTWKPAVADYDGDGKADLAWYVPAASNWRIYESSRGYAERWPHEGLGVPLDRPIMTPRLRW